MTELYIQLPYMAALLALLILLYKIVRDPAYHNFRCVYMVSSGEGFPDNDKLWLWGCFVTSTYGFLYLLWSGTLTEFYFVGYMGIWAASKAYAMKKRVEADVPAPSLSTTEETKTVSKTTVKAKK